MEATHREIRNASTTELVSMAEQTIRDYRSPDEWLQGDDLAKVKDAALDILVDIVAEIGKRRA